MASITQRETQQIEQANASGKTPVVFIHGLWLLPSSWDRWAALFEEAGYAPVTPVWPDDPETVEQARANPEVFAKKTLGQIAGHTAEVIGKLTKKPAVMGHSTGGLLAQIIAGRGLCAATVGIDPGPFRGVLPLPISALRSAMPVLGNPLNRGRAVTLTLDQFKYGWANALSEEEAKQLYETYHVAAPGVALIQMATANLNPWSEAKADTGNPGRGPLLIIDGEKDHTTTFDHRARRFCLLPSRGPRRGVVPWTPAIPPRAPALITPCSGKRAPAAPRLRGSSAAVSLRLGIAPRRHMVARLAGPLRGR
jgi:pimeloyl-ACP methyl ester carboxylesterase